MKEVRTTAKAVRFSLATCLLLVMEFP